VLITSSSCLLNTATTAALLSAHATVTTPTAAAAAGAVCAGAADTVSASGCWAIELAAVCLLLALRVLLRHAQQHDSAVWSVVSVAYSATHFLGQRSAVCVQCITAVAVCQ
jgi:hypothetical protein